MTHLKKYWYWYALGAAAIGTIVYFNWDTIKGWFAPAPGSTRDKKTECIGGFVTYAGVASNIPCASI